MALSLPAPSGADHQVVGRVAQQLLQHDPQVKHDPAALLGSRAAQSRRGPVSHAVVLGHHQVLVGEADVVAVQVLEGEAAL